VALKVPVLLYHAVRAVPPPGLERWTTAPEEFRQHMDVISASGRVPLTISELAACLRGERRLESDAVAVTFDDGYADTHDTVRELLRRGISSTVYVTSGSIGDPGMLSAAELRELLGLDGVEIGAHSVSHPHLDELAGDALDEEVAGSKRMLEMVLDAPVASFAYPHGSHDRRARAAVIRAGYGSAAAIKNAISHLEDDPFAIARWTVTAGTPPERIARVLQGSGVPIAWSRERLRTRVHRAARRARRRLQARTDRRHGLS
jgi:peptidoglycan/xylan/chitin deacetylase (PgdA/CDA1 family)